MPCAYASRLARSVHFKKGLVRLIHLVQTVQQSTITAIVPVRNEHPDTLDNLSALVNRKYLQEVIVVDCSDLGSTIEKLNQLQERCDSLRVIRAETPGRACQMNQGEKHATGDVLWFVHADTKVPQGAGKFIIDSISADRPWGRFDVRFSNSSGLMKLVAFTMNLRSELTGVCTGDQAIFVTRDLFRQLGGFPEIAIMEDVALTRKLKRHARTIRVRTPVVTSARRWESRGYFWTIFQMWMMRFLFWVGVSPQTLARLYR